MQKTLKTEKTRNVNEQTCSIICLNCCSIGLCSADMTGSLCRHTAAVKFHGELLLSITPLVFKGDR